MREKILEDLKTAMKNQDKDTLNVIRMVKGAMQLVEINLHHELSDEEMIDVIAKQIKTRKESLVEFEKGNREDLINQTNKEIAILNKYMPEQLSTEEVSAIIDEAFKQINPNGPSDMGKIMGLITPKLKGKTDMGLASKTVRDKING